MDTGVLGLITKIFTDIRYAAAFLIIFIFSLTMYSYQTIANGSTVIYGVDDEALTQEMDTNTVAIVFGGGITAEGPMPLLKDRLDTAKTLLDKRLVVKLLLSGDNRSEGYDEPQVMYDYLLDEGVPPQSMQLDQAGRSTYETCERAYKIFGLEKAVLVSEQTHLPRASFLCQHFGIETVNVKSDSTAAANLYVSQTWREILARNKAIINIHIKGEDTVLGEPIQL